MSYSLKTFFWQFTAFSCVVLPSCSKKVEIVEEIVQKPAIIATNFTIDAFAKQLIPNDSAIFFSPPLGTNPNNWTPTPDEVEEMKTARPIIFVAGEAPKWMDLLEQDVKIVNVLSSDSQVFNAAYNLDQAQAVFKQVSREMVTTFPEIDIRDGALDFVNQLEAQKIRWQSDPILAAYFNALPPKVEGLRAGIKKVTHTDDFLDLVESNYQLLTQSEEERRKREELLAEQQKLAGMSYVGGVVPILEKKCMDCHDEINEEGDLNFEVYLEEKFASMEPELWEKVVKVIENGQMPPPDKKKQLSSEEIEKLKNWSHSVSEKWDNGEMGKDPGRTVIHRLNKNEYNYTLRDLFKLNIRPSDNFPEDGGGDSGFDNNAESLLLPALLVENYFSAASQVVTGIYKSNLSKNRYLLVKPSPGLTAPQAAKKVIEYWATFIYRKPANTADIDGLMKIFEKAYEHSENYEEAMKMPLYAMLISPNFLYRASLTPEQNKPYRIDDFELASRLSYFLWSSMPDKELFRLASEGKLKDEEVLEQQVLRMLNDSRSEALGVHFGGQWFGWDSLRSEVEPDKKKFPEFTFSLRVALYTESMTFFNNLVKNDGSIYDLLDSDYTFLNEKVAKFYGITNVTGKEFRKVKLTDRNRGGVLGMGSVLAATSLSLRSSPTIRGAYVLRDVLGINLSEAPMNVPQVQEDDRAIGAMTFRESLSEHRSNPSCITCHQEIDPIGFGLESFDAIGRFRTHQNGVKLDTSGTMPDGREFASAIELKRALLDNKEIFVRNTVEKMLSYALGRNLNAYDRPIVKEISDKVIANKGSMQTAFIEVVKSYPFTHRRSDSFNASDSDTTQQLSKKAKRKKK
ncbi:DUF1592 domain-containing protein [Akkermansiaceae bacterium]|nr:DUF1592 domain-containing protein [Akkermansiaceae bacterium]